MSKPKSPTLQHWVANLRRLMEEKGLNPRSLSLKAGLNPTAVRDMFEGRSRFPRYDTAQALADVLETTPAILMGDQKLTAVIGTQEPPFHQDIDLLTEIIACLQETSVELDRAISPREFAAMTATIFQNMQRMSGNKNKNAAIGTQIHDLLDYENFRNKRKRP